MATAAAPDVVWRILTDVTRVHEWSHECRRVRWLDGATRGGVGVRFRVCRSVATGRSGISFPPNRIAVQRSLPISGGWQNLPRRPS
ncbi:SRPBCC family protein [Antrihabitans stalactiti]|uniref:SRPBCC family protein n=1 Tax=Antrihabitans stalactiti TaxID=2584121 RepID=UPI003B846860